MPKRNKYMKDEEKIQRFDAIQKIREKLVHALVKMIIIFLKIGVINNTQNILSLFL